MQIDVLAEDYVSIPLGLRNGVLAKATVDGKPAQMKIVTSEGGPVAQNEMALPFAQDNSTLFLLQLTGKGKHKLELEVRLSWGTSADGGGPKGRCPPPRPR